MATDLGLHCLRTLDASVIKAVLAIPVFNPCNITVPSNIPQWIGIVVIKALMD